MKIKSLFLLLLFFCQLNLKSATCSAVANGNWNNASTWSCGSVPLCNDVINIPSGYTVTVNTTITYTCASTINLYGELLFTTGNKLNLASGSSINIYSGGKIKASSNNASQKITIGGSGNSVWDGNDGPINGPAVVNSSGVSSTLPVELINFYAECVDNRTELSWSTATELNNEYFILEKSTNSYEWSLLAKIKGSGSSSSTKKYNFTDINNVSDIKYYRLSQVDIDKTKKTFNIIDIDCKNNKLQSLVYPNPASDELTIVLDDKNLLNTSFNILIFNNFGEIVLNKQIESLTNNNMLNISLSAINTGCYYIYLVSGQKNIINQKLMIIK